MIAQYILLSVKTVYIILSTRSKHIKGITETHFRMFLKTYKNKTYTDKLNQFYVGTVGACAYDAYELKIINVY